MPASIAMLSAPFEVRSTSRAPALRGTGAFRLARSWTSALRTAGVSAAEGRYPDSLDASCHFASRPRVKPAGTFRASLREADRLAPASADPAPRGRFQAELELHASVRRGASWNHHQKRAETERGCVRSTSRSGTARPRVLGSFGDLGHPHLLRLVLRTQPRSGGGSKMRPVRSF